MTSRPHSRINGGSLKVAAALVAIAACDSGEMTGPVPGVPASVAVAPDSAVLTYLGETAQFTARVTDGTGASVGGVVRWESTDRAVVTVDGSGLVTARGNGTAEVRASAGGASDAAPVRVEQRVATLRVFGDGQSALAGLSLPSMVGVAVFDAGDRPVVGTVVRFAVTSGGGTVEPDSAVSDGSGVASALWTLGVAPGEQRLVASVPDGPEEAIAALAVDPNSVVARVVPWSGNRQWGLVGQPLPEPVVVQALDEAGRPVPGALVSFTAEAGSGSVEPDSVRSDSAGLARAEWTLGPAPGEQTLAVAVMGMAQLEVTATAQPDAGVCGRTPVVIELLLRITGVAGCAAVTDDRLAAVSVMNLREKNITSLRSGDFAGLSRMEWLALRGNRLSALPPDIFADLDSLTRLDLRENQLESLPSGMLAGLQNLTNLALSFNRMTEIPSDVAGLARLRVLDLGSNPWRELPPDLFAAMTRLEYLFLGDVGLRELPPGLFKGLSSLTTLSLLGNHLTRLPAGIFDDLSSLEYLNLNGNQLTELPPRILAHLRELEVLYLADNELDSLNPAEFAGLSRLLYLNVAGNKLSELPSDVFDGLTNLGQLRLDDNQLSELPPDLFAGLSRLRYLNLTHNELTRLPPDLFGGLLDLKTLLLLSNAMAALPAGIFADLNSLSQLDLRFNELKALPRGVFQGLSNLTQLNLRVNPGAPFPVRLDVGRTDAGDALAPGPASVVLRVPSGAPLSMEMPVTVQGGTASGELLSVAAGDTVSAPLTVSRIAGTAAPVHVSLGLPRSLPDGFTGFEYVVGEELVLFAPSLNRSPVATDRVPLHWLQAGVETAEVDITEHFNDPDGDSLSYLAVSSGAAVVVARVEDGILELEPLAEGSASVEVTAEDPDGLRASLSVPVTVARAPDPAGFRIELFFADGAAEAERFTEGEKAAVRRAAARWEEVVKGELPDVPVDGGFCEGPERMVGRIDEVVIQVSLAEWGRINSIGQAVRCGERESGLPFLGIVIFNRSYYGPDAPETGPDSMYEVALHEMGHMLGIGSNKWGDMLREKTQDRDVPLDTHFPGPLAVEAFNEAGGRAYRGGKVPVDNGVSAGGLNVHWRYDVLRGELMGPRSGPALSAITVQALADLGYEVDPTRADPYELSATDTAPAADVAAAESESPFAGDVLKGPVVVVDVNGRVVRVIRN